MSKAPWETEHTLDPDRFARILERRFPEFHRPEVRALEPGWDYLTFRVDEDWAFKVPKRADVVSRMRQEVSLLTALPQMPAAVPRPSFHGVAADDLPYPFFGYPYLDGVFATDPTIDVQAVIPQALAFLDALHAIVPPFAVEGWPDGTWQQRVQKVPRVRASMPRFLPGLAWLADNPPVGASRKTLLHEDLGPEHLLLHPQTGELVAVLDWADASRGDPARDLCSLILWDIEATRQAHHARGDDPADLQRGLAHALLTGLQILDDHLRWNPEEAARWATTMEHVQENVLAG